MKEGESTFFLRCIRCESRNIIFPKPPKSLKLSIKIIIWLIVSIITGIIGAVIGLGICAAMVCSSQGIFGLIGFLIGFFIPLYTLIES